MSYPRIAFSVGVFVLISSVLILISLLYVIEKKGVFEKQVYYKLICENAQEIEEGMPILFSGFEIAQVDELSLYQNGEVLILIKVPHSNTKWIRSDALFILEKPLIGNPKIILKSSMSKPPLNVQVISRVQIKEGINQIISDAQPLILELQSIVKNVNILSTSLSDKNASFQGSLKNLERFSSDLADSPNLLYSFTKNPQSASQLHQSITQLNTSLKNINTLSNNTNTGIHEVRQNIINPAKENMQELKHILKDINSKLKEIDGTFRLIGQSDEDIERLKGELDLVLEETKGLSIKINEILGDTPQEDIILP